MDVLAACDYTSFTCTMEELERVCCMRHHHGYKEIWKAAVGEVLSCEREGRNARDCYAVAVKMTGTTDIVVWALAIADIVGQCWHVNYSL